MFKHGAVAIVVVGVGFGSIAYGRMSERQRLQEEAQEAELAKRASQAIEKLPNNLTLKVGERKFFAGYGAAICGKGGIIQVRIDARRVMEVKALKAGRTVLIPEAGFDGARGGPKGKQVMVTVVDQ